MIVIADTQLENTLKNILQENVTFSINNNKWKTGKLRLFKQTGFYIEFILEKKNKTERFEVPIPFNEDIKITDNVIIFDYTLNTLARGNEYILNLIDEIDHEKNSKFYNNKMVIKINEI